MSIPVSTVPAVQSALLTAINAAALSDSAPSDFLVCIGEPSTNAPPAIIEIAKDVRRTVDPPQFVGSGGQGWLEEHYDIDVVVSVAQADTNVDVDALALSERAWQLVGYVETAIRTDPSFGDIVQLAYPREVTGGEVTWAANDVGAVCELTIAVHVEAII
jgi:hypothetical protein